MSAGPSERQAIEPGSPWWGIHVARYRFAVPYVRGARVLDVACGMGYGLAILEQTARCVVGVDADFTTVRGVQEQTGRAAEQVLVADGCHLPFPDGAFDVVTSFETIEHLERRSDFLAEVRRVLKPEGCCILSTPNADYTRPVDGKPKNPFHRHEYAPEELRAELEAHFEDVTLLGQALDARFMISPFWEDQQRLPKTPLVQARLLTWKALNRLPGRVGSRVSGLLWGHPLVPTETDYRFLPAVEKTMPVLVAVCRPAGRTA